MKKVLVIEDDQIVRTNICQLLEESGYDVNSAENGTEGLRLIDKELPDIIICDVLMPEKNGYEVLKELGKNSRTSSIPFIFLTAKAEIADIRLGMQSGADDYLLKPFTSAELLKAVELRLNKRHLIAQNEKSKLENEEAVAASEGFNKAIDYDSSIFLLAGNNPEIVKISRIKYILAESEYSRVFTLDNKKLLIRRLLKEWEKILPQEQFFRIHRSTIINVEHIIKIEKWFNHSFRIHINGSAEPFVVSRRVSSKLRTMLSINS